MTTETQTATRDSGTDKNRKLKIKCTPTLEWVKSTFPYEIKATMAFEEESDGTEPDMSGAVAPGDNGVIVIDISHMKKDDKYNENLDITLKLETKDMKNADGSKLTGNARWALATEGSETFNGVTYAPLGYLWFCTPNPESPSGYDRMPPHDIPDVSRARDDNDDKLIQILDDTPDGAGGFGFCVGFVLEGYGNYYISIDPRITSKGTENAAFMLKK